METLTILSIALVACLLCAILGVAVVATLFLVINFSNNGSVNRNERTRDLGHFN